MPTREQIVANLHAMHETPAAGVRLDEARSLESPNVPLTASQLLAIGGLPTRAGIQVTETNALSYVAVYAAIRVLAESVAMLPLITYRGDPTGSVRSRATTHPVYRLLAYEPNPEMTAAVFMETLQGHLGGWGNAYARIAYDNAGRPKSLWPLRPDSTRAERQAGQLVYTTDGSGTFAPEEILHIPGLGFDGLRGYSPIGLAREAIGLGKAAEMFGAGFFGNGANVGGIITVPGKLTKEQRAENTAAWNSTQGGLNNVAKTALIDGGAKYERVGIPPEDAQFLETRKFQISEIARLYRVPPHMLADLEKATFANIEQQSLEFLIYTLTPWLEKWEQELNRKLFSPGEEMFVSFDERRLLRSDNTARQAYYASARQWGYLNVNEIRSEEGLNPIGDEGDVYLQPVNMAAAGQQLVSTPKPAQALPSAPATAKDDKPAARAADLMLDVVTEAVTRMARKESNAVARAAGNSEKLDRFYAEHERHVAEALAPAAATIIRLCQGDAAAASRASAVIAEYARRRHAETNTRDLAIESAALAAAVQQSIEGSH